MRPTALILSFGLLWVSLPAAAETSRAGVAPPPQARVGSLAPDEARRAERARRRAAAKNAATAARDVKVTEGKSVAVPGDAPGSKVVPTSTSKAPASAGAAAKMPSAPPIPAVAARTPSRQDKTTPANAASAPVAVPSATAFSSRPTREAATNAARGREAGPRNVDRVRSSGRDADARDQRSKRYAARHKARYERFATDGSGDRRFQRQAMIVDDPRALPGAPPYPMAPRFREVYVVRAAPPPAFWGYGPRRPFYPPPGYMREPIDDVD